MKWIKTTDRLPPNNTHVIGYCMTPSNKDLHVEPLLFQEYEEEALWAYLFAYNEGYDYAKEVTHWQPLPEFSDETLKSVNKK